MSLALGLTIGVIAAPAATPTAPATTRPVVARQQKQAVLLSAHTVRASPGGKIVGTVRAWLPITGEQPVLPVLGRADDGRGRTWLRVRLPGRTLTGPALPRIGFIRLAGTAPSVTTFHMVVIRAARRVEVYQDGRLVRSFSAVIGKPATPTPRGQFYVEEGVPMGAGAPGAPYALATSARSAVLREFDGGPGQIAFHGRRNIGGTLGTAVSHGCIRLSDAAISWLRVRIVAGTPVTIR